MHHMSAVKNLRFVEKFLKAEVAKLRLRRLKHMEPLGLRLNIVARVKMMAVKRSRGIPGA